MCELWDGVSREKSIYLVVLAAVVQSWDTSCVHCVKVQQIFISNHAVYEIHSFSILSDDRSKASSKTIPPYSAI